MTTDLPFPEREHWPWRWMYTERCRTDGKLHRVVQVREQEDWAWVGVIGRTACGIDGKLLMPGMFSRMGRPRCKHCCRIVGVPEGDGAPYNQGIDA